MKITKRIIDRINEDTNKNNIKNSLFSKTIDLLIKDEKEAIKGYKSGLSNLESSLTDSQYDTVQSVFSHIIQEEEEHIEELKELLTKLN